MECNKKHKAKRPSFGTRLLLRSSRGRRVDGLWIGSLDDDAEPVLHRVEEALNLIKAYDPLRYKRLIRDLERIWVTMIPGGFGNFDESIWACVLDRRHVLSEKISLERIAAWIVHEATHARLRRCGIGYDGKELRARVEAVCFRRERAFAAKLPNGNELSELADRYLEFYGDREQWTMRRSIGGTKRAPPNLRNTWACPTGHSGLPDQFACCARKLRRLASSLSAKLLATFLGQLSRNTFR